MVKREVAKKKRVKDLFKGEFKESKDINTPNRVETKQSAFSRVNVLATIEDTYMNQEETYGSIQITDNTATIRVKAFEETTDYLENLDKGDLVKVIGKVRKDEDGRFILGEIIRKIQNPKYSELRETELKNQKESSEENQKEAKEETQKEFVEETGPVE